MDEELKKELQQIKAMLRFIVRELTYVPDYPPKPDKPKGHLKRVK